MKTMLFYMKKSVATTTLFRSQLVARASIIVLDSKSAMYMAKNGKDPKHTRHIARRMNFVRNREKCKMHKIDWCEGVMQLAEIGNNNLSEPYLTSIMKYIMVRL